MFWQWGRARRCPRSSLSGGSRSRQVPRSHFIPLFILRPPVPRQPKCLSAAVNPSYPRSIHPLPPMFLSAPSQSPLLSQVNSFPVAYRASSHFDYKPLYIRIICFNAQISQKSRHKNRSVDIPPQKKLLVILTTSFIFVRIYVCRG